MTALHTGSMHPLGASPDSGVRQAFLLASADTAKLLWLSATLADLGTLTQIQGDAAHCLDALAKQPVRAVFLDFSPAQIENSSTLARAITQFKPGLPLVAVGSSAHAESVLAALRVGVRDFLDTTAPAADALQIVSRILEQLPVPLPPSAAVQGKIIAVLGARGGVGATTAALNLAMLAQRNTGKTELGALLLDFGMPIADAMLYLSLQNQFHFVEAVRNLRRFDPSFIRSAFGMHSSGMAVLPLPAHLAEMRDISYEDAFSLLDLLRTFFHTQVIDLGGFSNTGFITQIVQQADAVLLVTDQSVGSIVSATQLLQSLREHGARTDAFQLLLSKYDTQLALSPEDIALRLNVSPCAALPARALQIVQGINQGKALVETQPRDPYVRALEALLPQLVNSRPNSQNLGADALPIWKRVLRNLKT